MEVFYIWDCNEKFIDVFLLLLPFLTENRNFDTVLLAALVKEECVKLSDALRMLPFILKGYLATLPAAPQQQPANTDS